MKIDLVGPTRRGFAMGLNGACSQAGMVNNLNHGPAWGLFPIYFADAVLLGAGTAMVYPTLLAAVGDVAHPGWRARSVGIYRLRRDAGFAVAALLAGIVADVVSTTAAIWAVAALTAASGLLVSVRMYETHPHTNR